MKPWIVCMGIVGLAMAPVNGEASPLVVTFDDLALSGSDTYYNGGPTDNTNGWVSQGVGFGNSFTDFGDGFISWNGFAYSNVNDTTTGDYTNQYAAITGTAFSGSIYAVAYSGSQDFINLPVGYQPASVRVTNTTYAALDMANGSAFSRKFGAGDFLTVTFTGYSNAGATGTVTGSTTFYLGDFLDGKSTIVNTWELLDLTPLGAAASVGLSWASSDVDPVYGINTPTYAAIDSLTLTPVPEPSSMALLACAGACVIAGMWRRRVRSA